VTPRLPLGSRLLLGGIAGFVATLPMTVVVRMAHRRLPARERYPAPPRELIDVTAQAAGISLPEAQARDLTLAAHYLYGAGSGAMLAALVPRPGIATGAVAGTAVWAASYLGWIPALGLLTPATDHPVRRNTMMIGAHLVWGVATALALRELLAEREAIIGAGPDRDAAP
jgi:uncharacterized membrane protein YagU involved in acid resistance